MAVMAAEISALHHRNKLHFKGVIGCKIHVYMFEQKCVLALCVHNHPIMIKIHLVFCFLIQINKYPLFQIKPFSDTDPGPSHDCWFTLFYLRPALSELSSVRHSSLKPLRRWNKMSPKRLRCFVAGCNYEHRSQHLLKNLKNYINLWKMGIKWLL